MSAAEITEVAGEPDRILILLDQGHSSEPNVRDMGGWIQGRQPGRYAIDYSADLSPNVLDSATSLDSEQLELLESYDLIIMPRHGAGPSSDFGSKDWNDVSTPILNMNPFTYRHGIWGWGPPDVETPTSPSLQDLVAASPESRFFTGVEISSSGMIPFYREADATMQFNVDSSIFTGEVVGWTDVESGGTHQEFPWIVFWNGTENRFYEGGSEEPAAGRTLFLGPLSNSPDAFTSGGQQVFLNAIALTIDPDAELEVRTPAKSERTYYTDERIDEIHDSLGSAVAAADGYLQNHSLAELWRFVPGQALPRSFSIHSQASSAVYSSPQPWKVEVEIEGEERLMPSNDFEAYYESGLDENGWFDPDLADQSLLVNELYPDKPDDWGVDDGWGWIDDDGTHWTFIAHYLHWHRFIQVRWRIQNLRDAYLYTGDPKYARAGLIIMDRLADIYPLLDISEHDTSVFRNSNGGTGTGKMVGRFWEANHIRQILAGYDAFFPLIEEGDASVVDFLSGKAEKYNLGAGRGTIEGIALNIEDNIVREILPSVKLARIRGDFGNPAALAMAAVVLDEPEGYTAEVLEFMMQSGGLENIDGEWRTTGGGILPYLVDQTDRDGHADRGAPQYNRIYAGRMGVSADILQGYDAPPELNLAEHPKYLLMRDSQKALSMLDRYVPTIGDSYLTGNPTRHAHSPSPEESANLAGYGFSALRDGERDPETWPDDRRAAWVYYGRNAMRDADGNRIAGGHAHRNALQLGLYGFGLDLAPDLGYPEQTGSWPKRVNWTANTISHNTVVVDAERQEGHWVGIPRHFEANEKVRFIDVEAPIVYPQTETYRRSTAMIRVDGKNSYLVDLFRVRGGSDHLFSFHGAEGPVELEGLNTETQPGGTYAGEDIPLPGHGENTGYNNQVGNGFNYLYNVRRAASPAGGFSVEWRIEDSWDVLPADRKDGIRLRLTMLNDDLDELALAHGDPPQHVDSDNPRRLNYMLARRQGDNLETSFTSVIEPYRGERFVRSVEALDIVPADNGGPVPDSEARALRVELENGSTDTIVQSTNPGREYEVDGAFRFQGVFGVFREDVEGRPSYSYLHGGKRFERVDDRRAAISRDEASLSVVVLDFTDEMSTGNFLDVGLKEAAEYVDKLAGRWIYVETDGWRNGAYEIHDATLISDERIRLDLGATTLIREYVDPFDFSEGFVHNISIAASAEIPLSAEIDSPPAESFEAWIEELPAGYRPPEGERGPLDTPAGDGVANLLKYAFGLMPIESAGDAGPRLVVSDGFFALEFDRSRYADVEWEVQVSGNLSEWDSVHFETEVLGDIDDERERVRLVSDIDSGDMSAERFLRLVVGLP